jgi:uncharacterized OsmC-like protein
MPASRVNLREIQAPLRERYTSDPSAANLVLEVHSDASDLADPLHCAVSPASVAELVWRSGAHPAVGGVGDVPCSGDLLLAALAACQEVTLRMVAANMGISLASVDVHVEGDWDARGTLAMGKEFPVGLKSITCRTTVTLDQEERPERAERLLRSAERYCVVLNTLRGGVDVTSEFSLGTA